MTTSTLRTRIATAVALAASATLILGACSDSETENYPQPIASAEETPSADADSGGDGQQEEVDLPGTFTNPLPMTNPIVLESGLEITIEDVRTDVAGSEIGTVNCDRNATYDIAIDVLVTNPNEAGTAPVDYDETRVVTTYDENVYHTVACAEVDLEQTENVRGENTLAALAPGQQLDYTYYIKGFDFDDAVGFQIDPDVTQPEQQFYTDLGEFATN